MSGEVVKGRCANHKCTRKATAQGSRMSASLRMDGALHSAGGDFSFSGAELLPEPHSTTRPDPPRVSLFSAPQRSSAGFSPPLHVCLRRSERGTNERRGARPRGFLGTEVHPLKFGIIQRPVAFCRGSSSFSILV